MSRHHRIGPAGDGVPFNPAQSYEPAPMSREKLGRAAGVAPLVTTDPVRWQGADVPPRRWLVDGLIPVGDAVLCYGDGGTGKSLLALQLLVATVLGRDWLGLPVRRGKAIGVFCEDDADELHRRLAGILKHYGADFADLEGLRLVPRVGMPNDLMVWEDFKPGEETHFYTQLMNLAIDSGAQLVVLDSLHDFFGGNENSRPVTRRFMASLRTIATELDGNVLVNAHPSRAGMSSGTGDSGNTAWSNSTRCRLYLDRPRDEEADENERVLRTMKSNYGTRGAIRLRWADGVLERIAEPTGTVAIIERQNAQGAFLVALRALTKQGRATSHAKNAAAYAPRIMVGMAEVGKLTKRDLERAMAELFAAGKIIANARIGTKENRHPLVGIAEVPTQPDLDLG